MLDKVFREPLVHFLGGALLVFAFFWATGNDRDSADYAIGIDESDLARLEANWIQNFRRAPTQAELDSLIDQEIAEEIYYREALRLGLDKNDPVIRRRLFTKMRFLDEANKGDEAPSDAVLQQWMDKNPGKYALPPLYDIEQVYFGRISTAEASVRLDQLNAGADRAAYARSISLPIVLKRVTGAEIARQFGDQFAERVEKFEPGRWNGPVNSGFGVHAVKIISKTPGKSAALQDVRQRVVNDWRADRQATESETALARYRSQYEVTVAGRP